MPNLFQKYLTLFIIFLLLFNWGNFVFASGAATVSATIQITVCGNGIIETGEECDPLGPVLGGQTCQSKGYTGGTLSCLPSCDFDTSACTTAGGSSGGGYTPPPTTTTTLPGTGQVNFTGRAYPKSTVTLLKDAQIVATTIAGSDANFQISLTNVTAGSYIFSVYSEDDKGNRSSLLTFPLSVTSGVTTNVTGIFIAPTIAVDKSEVKRGDDIAIFGQTAPQADITISVNSDEEFFAKTISDKDGIYFYNFDTTMLDYATHYTKSKSVIGNLAISSWSSVIGFKVGTKNVFAQLPAAPAKGDLNGDKRVNLIDFSITAYWYKRSSPPQNVDLNKDGKVDLVDFSIMAYYWTG